MSTLIINDKYLDEYGYITGDLITQDSVHFTCETHITGDLIVSGDITADEYLSVGGNILYRGKITISNGMQCGYRSAKNKKLIRGI